MSMSIGMPFDIAIYLRSIPQNIPINKKDLQASVTNLIYKKECEYLEYNNITYSKGNRHQTRHPHSVGVRKV